MNFAQTTQAFMGVNMEPFRYQYDTFSLYFTLLIAILCGVFSFSAKSQDSVGVGDSSLNKIFVGPNIPVSSNGSVAHVETDIADNPTADSSMVSTSIAFSRPDGGFTCKVYTSTDGGITWIKTNFAEPLPHGVGLGGGDPQVAYGPKGTVYFTMIGFTPNGAGMSFYRSEDDGLSWHGQKILKPNDHPQMTVDPGSERFGGRIYISSNYGQRRPGLYYSSDNGQTFSGPIYIPNPENYWVLTEEPLVFSDGTLFLPYRVWDDTEGKKITEMTTMFVTSKDGGESFSNFHKIAKHPYEPYDQPKQYPGSFISENPSPTFAIDRNEHKGRIYAAWSDARLGNGPRVFLTFSDDRGQTWNPPQVVSPNVPDKSAQFQVMLAVGHNGIVGLAWFDTRDFPNEQSYHVYFSATTDGSETFLPPKRVTSVPSIPYGEGNLRFAPNYIRSPDSVSYKQIGFISAYSRWAEGGDYLGMTTNNNTFFPLWADSRTGVFQLMTSPIRVQKKADLKQKDRSGILRKISVTNQVELIWGHPKYDKKKRQATFPVRLKNKGESPIYAPIRVHIDSLEHFSILQSANIRNSDAYLVEDSSLIVDYTLAMERNILRPGTATGVLEWKFKYRGIRERPSFQISVTGQK